MEKPTLKNFAKSLKHGLFADRKNLKDAMSHAYSLIATLDPEDRSVAFTALHIVLNTVAKEIEQLSV